MAFHKLASILLLPFLLMTLNACTNTRIPPQENMPIEHINIQHRINIATALFKQKNYYDSLVQWKILRSIQPDNPTYKNRVRVTQSLINRRAKIYLKDANTALEKGSVKNAELIFFKILALKPNHRIAISKIKRIEADRAEFKQKNKTKRQLVNQKLAQENIDTNNTSSNAVQKIENQQALLYLEAGIELFNNKDWRGSIREINKYLTTNPTNKDAINIVTASHINLSKIFENRGHLEPAIQHMEDLVALDTPKKTKYKKKLLDMKQRLSANYYIEGIKIYRKNIDQAINYWRRAASINPNNRKAAIRLKKAIKMKDKLSSIRPKASD